MSYTGILLKKQLCKFVFYGIRNNSIPVPLIGYSNFIRSFSNKMEKPQVYVTRNIETQEANDILKKYCDVTYWTEPGPVPKNELLKNIVGKQALFCMLTDKIDSEILNAAGTSLKVISTMSVGYDHLDIQEIKKRNIKIGYTPNVLTDATAELTVALLLATSRRLLEANKEAKTGGWQAWSPFWMCGPSLSGSTVGIVGFGRIGQEVAKRLKPFNVKKFVYNSRSEKQDAYGLGAVRVDFDELLKQSDFVVVTCSLTPETEKLFDKNAFARMKRNAVFINSSRGGVVDQDALTEALANKVIWAAGLDVMTPEPLPLDSPLLKLDNCIILPHIGSASIETRNTMAILTANNIISALKGDNMPAELNV